MKKKLEIGDVVYQNEDPNTLFTVVVNDLENDPEYSCVDKGDDYFKGMVLIRRFDGEKNIEIPVCEDTITVIERIIDNEIRNQTISQ